MADNEAHKRALIDVDEDASMAELADMVKTSQALFRATKRLKTSVSAPGVVAMKAYVASQLLRAGRALDQQVKSANNERHGARWSEEEDALILQAFRRTETRDPKHRLMGSVPGRTDKAITEHIASVLLARKAQFKLTDEQLTTEFNLTPEELQAILDTGNEGNAQGGPPPLLLTPK